MARASQHQQAIDRLGTARAMFALGLARVLVSAFPLRIFSSSLGVLVRHTEDIRPKNPGMPASQELNWLARRIERAASRLPGRSKCLPKAIALQWALGKRDVPSQLVVAVHRNDRTSDDAFHAWVEHQGTILIGHCDRSEYSPIMVFSQPAALDQDRG